MIGSHLIKIISEAILRGGIKTIPVFGAGIDQATFGIKDAVYKNEIRELLETILKLLEETRPSADKLTDEEVRLTLAQLHGNPIFNEIENRLNTRDKTALQELTNVAISLQSLAAKGDAILIDVEDIWASVIRGNQEILHAIEKSILYNNEEFKRTQEHLALIGTLPEKAHKSKPHKLSDIYDALGSSNIKLLALSGHSFGVALGYSQIASNLSATIDFSEIYRYSFSPYLADPLAPLSVYFINRLKSPLLLLPGSVEEMKCFLGAQLSTIVDRRKLENKLSKMFTPNARLDNMPFGDRYDINNLKLMANVILHNNSPLRRMKRLFSSGKIKRWDGKVPSNTEFKEYTLESFKFFSNCRKGTSQSANYHDAINLSLLRVLNANCRPSEPNIIHVSGATSMLKAGDKLSRLMNNDNNYDVLPLVVHPLAWAYRYYILHADHIDFSLLTDASDDLYHMNHIVKNWANVIREPDWHDLPVMSEELHRVMNSLSLYFSLAEPFHRKVLEAELADLSLRTPPIGSSLWEERIGLAINETIQLISDLLSYIDPVSNNMKYLTTLVEEIFDGTKDNTSNSRSTI